MQLLRDILRELPAAQYLDLGLDLSTGHPRHRHDTGEQRAPRILVVYSDGCAAAIDGVHKPRVYRGSGQ